MARHKRIDLEVSDSNTYTLPSYNELSKAFHEMHVEFLNAFNKISSQNKKILALEEQVLKLKRDLQSLKKDHASLVNGQLCISNTL